MKASKLVKQLQEEIDLWGDQDVYVMGFGGPDQKITFVSISIDESDEKDGVEYILLETG